MLPTPGSLSDHRVEAPTLDQQLSEYERRQALLEANLEEVDPEAAQRVYLLVAGIIGILAAAALGGAFVLAGWLLQVF